MDETIPSMTTLFQQLGLDEHPQAMAEFIQTHQLPTEVAITSAPYWTLAQCQFLTEQLSADASWAIVIDQLNQSLHADGVKRCSDGHLSRPAGAGFTPTIDR